MPRDDASALDWLLFEQSGVLSWKQAVAELGPAKVRHLVATRRGERVCRGVLRTHTGAYTVEQHWWVAVLAAGEGALLAGLADMRRQNDIWARGDRILRFASFDLRVRPAEVAAQIRDALRAAGWRR